VLNGARNPPSTAPITISIVLFAKISLNTQYSYQNCSATFWVNTPNAFKMSNFAITNTTISATNVLTLSLQLNNPISSMSYLRINPNSLRLTYLYNNYNQGTQPSQNPTNDSTLLISNLTTSTTTSPSFLVLNNFTLVNPPYANKPVPITFTTSNLIANTYYLIDTSTVTITASPSTIVSYGMNIATTSINALTGYTVWFVTINQLVIGSYIVVVFPSEVSLLGSTCSLASFSSVCVVNNSTSLTVTLNTLASSNTNMTITISSVSNPATTTPTGSLIITTYYMDNQSVVDQLVSGLIVTATSVQLKSVTINSSSLVVGQTSVYNVIVNVSNMLPAGSAMSIAIPISSYGMSGVGLGGFYIGTTLVSGCVISVTSSMVVKLASACFSSSVPAGTSVRVVLNNITNPLSTKPCDSWQVRTQYNGY